MSAADFTVPGYLDLVGRLLALGYQLRSFHDVEPARRHLVLRHDIDQSILSARTLADAESAQGWRSTWFVLVRTEMYNPFSRGAAAHLRAMIAAGHEIGLHLDATHYDDATLDAGCAVECRVLEDIVGSAVRMVSFHRPRPELIGSERSIGGRMHAYMPRFTQQLGYCSDSRGAWRHGHPLDHEAVADRRALQLLTHAVWWVGRDGRDARGRLADVLEERASTLSRELADNNDVWRGKGDA